MDSERASWMSLLKVPRPWAVFVLLAVIFASSSAMTVDMPQIADMSSIGASGFSCEGKVIGGYYADIASGCQMFHVCTLGQEGEIRDIKFLCLAGTVFDQETRVCERVDEVDCANSESFYDLNLDLYGQHGLILQTGRKVPSGETGTFADEENLQQQSDTFYDYQDYEDEFQETSTASTTTTSTTTIVTTPTPTSSTTTHTSVVSDSPTQANKFPSIAQSSSSVTSTPSIQHSSEPHQELDGQHHVLNSSPEFQPQSTTAEPAETTTSHQPDIRVRPQSDITDEEDVLSLLEQIKVDVPRIPSFTKSSSSHRNNIFVPRIRRDVVMEPTTVSTPRRNRTRKTGAGRRAGYSSTSSTVRTRSDIAPSTPLGDKGAFSCAGRVTGGFYADVSSGCRRFFICTLGKKNRIVSHSFACGVGLLFDQATLTCQDIDKVDCSLSSSFFHLNDPALRPDPEAKEEVFLALKTKSTETS